LPPSAKPRPAWTQRCQAGAQDDAYGLPEAWARNGEAAAYLGAAASLRRAADLLGKLAGHVNPAAAPPAWTAIVAIPVGHETDRMVVVDLEALGLDETWTFCQLIGDGESRVNLLFHPDDGEDRDCPNCLEDPDDAIDAYAG
jgi:hypothetical protein